MIKIKNAARIFVLLLLAFCFCGCASNQETVENNGEEVALVPDEAPVAETPVEEAVIPAEESQIADSGYLNENKDQEDEYEIEYFRIFTQLYREGGMEDMEKFMEEWAANKPDDPDLYAAKFNYYLKKGTKSEIYYSENLPSHEGQFMSFTNPEDGKTYYIQEEVSLDEECKKKAIDTIEEALVLYPNRLDLWFGLTSFYVEVWELDNAENLLLRCFEQLKTNNNEWMWLNSVKVDEGLPKKERDWNFSKAVHDYVSVMVGSAQGTQMADEKSWETGAEIATALLKILPHNHIMSNDMAFYYMNKGEYDKALAIQEDSLAFSPGDMVIVYNIALMAACNGDDDTFQKYIKIILECDDPDYVQWGNELLENYTNNRNEW